MITNILDLLAATISLTFAAWLLLWGLGLIVKTLFPEWYRRHIADDAPDGHW